jgi:hypothetical protein
MVNRVFANLTLDGGKLRYTLREPFDRMLNLTDRQGWQGRQDSNLRHPVLEICVIKNAQQYLIKYNSHINILARLSYCVLWCV